MWRTCLGDGRAVSTEVLFKEKDDFSASQTRSHFVVFDGVNFPAPTDLWYIPSAQSPARVSVCVVCLGSSTVALL